MNRSSLPFFGGIRLGGWAIAVLTACLIAMVWIFTQRSITEQKIEISDRVTTTLTNQTLTFSEQIARQILSVDQTLRVLARAWEVDPARFEIDTWRSQSVASAGISRDILVVDQAGIVRQSTLPDAIGQNISNRDFFRKLVDTPAARDRLFVGPATIDDIVRQWHLDVARPLRRPDGSFAGAIVVDFRISALTNIFNQINIGGGGLVALIGLANGDGRVRAAIGPPTVDPEATIEGTALFRAMRRDAAGMWVGPSPMDSVLRIHAFRAVPGRDLAVVVGMEEQEAMLPATHWEFQAYLFAGGITFLLLVIAFMHVRSARDARRREAALAEDRANLAAANAQLEVARARADAKTEQLEATLAGMTDGIAMMDAHFCLVEWNARFPEIAGVPADILRVGLPMEEILRAQARAGQFGPVDPDVEVPRRMAILSAGRFGTVERQRPDGVVMELRRNRLPDGGFVTLYADITDRKRAEVALQEARAAAEAANAAKSRFVAIVSHEIRTPLNALLNTLRLLSDSDIAASHRSLLDMARQSGDALSGLINDILDMSRAEAGQLALRPSLFSVAMLCEGTMDVLRGQAAARGIEFQLDIADNVPPELFTDPGRLRQVLLNLLSNAVKFASPGPVRLDARMQFADGRDWVAMIVRDRGPVIDTNQRQNLFRPFSRLDRGDGDETVGSGLGLAICRYLVGLMGGTIDCEPWVADDGNAGNAFRIRLPLDLIPGRTTTSPPLPTHQGIPSDQPLQPPPLPRTRILLVEDSRANQIVTATLLRRDRHLVDIAASGEAAIRALEHGAYDIVFMDMFMPGMNGQEATQRIRALRGPARDVPIIALTAHVSPGEEANFRTAGMNGLLGKPVSLDELRDAIGRYVWGGHPGGVAPPPSAVVQTRSVEPEAAPVLSVERIAELRTNLAPETFASLIEECIIDLDHRMPALRRALTAAVPGSIVAQAHAMVGIAAGYGLQALETTLRDIMNAARDGDMEALGGKAISAAQLDLARSIAALRDLLRKELV